MKEYHKNGELYAEGNMKHDCKVGEWRYYNDRGTLIHVINYKIKKIKKTVLVHEKHKEPELVERIEYEQVMDGKYESYFQDGTLASKGIYIKGEKKNGKEI